MAVTFFPYFSLQEEILLMSQTNYAASWIKTGAVCGLLSMVVYFAAAFAPLPPLATYVAAFAFGPMLAIGCAGLFYFLINDDSSPRVMIATVSGVAASIMLLLMLTVQQSSFATMEKHTGTGNEDIKAGYKYITDGLNSVHFGMDIAWDILISIATILYGYSLLKKTIYWKVLGIVGSLLGLLLLSFNLYHFPTPPESAGSIDWGPFVAIWYIVLFSSITSLLLRKKVFKIA